MSRRATGPVENLPTAIRASRGPHGAEGSGERRIQAWTRSSLPTTRSNASVSFPVASARVFSKSQEEATSADTYSESELKRGRTASQPGVGPEGGMVAQEASSAAIKLRTGRRRNAALRANRDSPLFLEIPSMSPVHSPFAPRLSAFPIARKRRGSRSSACLHSTPRPA